MMAEYGLKKNKYKNFYDFVISRYNWFSQKDKDNLLTNDFKDQIQNDQNLNANWQKNLGEGS